MVPLQSAVSDIQPINAINPGFDIEGDRSGGNSARPRGKR
jgi:hypothetical protein